MIEIAKCCKFQTSYEWERKRNSIEFKSKYKLCITFDAICSENVNIKI